MFTDPKPQEKRVVRGMSPKDIHETITNSLGGDFPLYSTVEKIGCDILTGAEVARKFTSTE